MTGFLIDTNVISEFTKPSPEPRVIRWLDAADPAALFVSVITLGELRMGIESMPTGKRRISLEYWLAEGLPTWFASNLLPVSRQIADRWGRVAVEARQKGFSLTTADAQIAATAMEHDLTVVTRNIKDFLPLEISILDPWEI